MTFSRILVPLDGSEFAEQALGHAGLMGRAFSGRITLIQVLDASQESGVSGTDSVDWRLRRVEARRYLASIAGDPRLEGLKVNTVLTEGRPAELIIDFIDRNAIDLMVLSCWGAGGGIDFPFGGTAHKLVSNTEISHLVVRDGPRAAAADAPAYRRVLVPLDGSQDAEMAAFTASAFDEDQTLDILLLHVVCRPSMPRRRPLTGAEESLRDQLVDSNRRAAAAYLEELRDRMGTRHSVQVRMEVADHPARRIIDVCQQVRPDLLILTAHRSNGSGAWGSDSILPFLLSQVEIPVLTLRNCDSASLAGLQPARAG